MIELLVALLGAGGALILLRLFDKQSIDKHQKKLEKEVSDIKAKQARLEGEQAQEDKETKEKIDAIDKEKNEELVGDRLVDFFRNRK